MVADKFNRELKYDPRSGMREDYISNTVELLQNAVFIEIEQIHKIVQFLVLCVYLLVGV